MHRCRTFNVKLLSLNLRRVAELRKKPFVTRSKKKRRISCFVHLLDEIPELALVFPIFFQTVYGDQNTDLQLFIFVSKLFNKIPIFFKTTKHYLNQLQSNFNTAQSNFETVGENPEIIQKGFRALQSGQGSSNLFRKSQN